MQAIYQNEVIMHTLYALAFVYSIYSLYLYIEQ